MAKECLGGVIMTPNGPLPLSKATKAGDFVFISGQLAVVDGQLIEGGMTEQATQVMQHIKDILVDANLTMKDIVKCNCWVTSQSDFAAFNAAYASFFPEEPPARATVISELAIPGALVEVDAVAYCGK